MSTTRAALRQELDIRLGLTPTGSTVARTATGGSTTTVVDSSAVEHDDYWHDYWLYITDTTDDAAPKDEESLVTDFVASSHTYTVSPAFTAAVGSGDTYELRRYFPAKRIHSVIDMVLEEAQNIFPNLTEDESLVAVDDTYDYTIPSNVQNIHRIELMEHDILYRGTATGSTSTTLTDSSQSWTEDDLIGQEVAIYDGTGAGQYRTISDNTASQITVSVAWATNPSTDSKYVIKDLTEEYTVSPITHVKWVGTALHIYEDLTLGQRLRIVYTPVHTTLASDASTTTVPKQYVVLCAMKHLILMAPALLPDSAVAQRLAAMHDRIETAIVEYLRRNRPSDRQSTLWNRGGTKRTRWNSPYITSSEAYGTRVKL